MEKEKEYSSNHTCEYYVYRAGDKAKMYTSDQVEKIKKLESEHEKVLQENKQIRIENEEFFRGNEELKTKLQEQYDENDALKNNYKNGNNKHSGATIVKKILLILIVIGLTFGIIYSTNELGELKKNYDSLSINYEKQKESYETLNINYEKQKKGYKSLKAKYKKQKEGITFMEECAGIIYEDEEFAYYHTYACKRAKTYLDSSNLLIYNTAQFESKEIPPCPDCHPQ